MTTCACTKHCCAEAERLRIRIAQLEDALGASIAADYVGFGMTPMEARLFALLMKRELVTRAAFELVVYGGRADSDWPVYDVFRVYAHRLRRRLQPRGITIQTVWGQGFRMPPEEKRKAVEAFGLKPARAA